MAWLPSIQSNGSDVAMNKRHHEYLQKSQANESNNGIKEEEKKDTDDSKSAGWTNESALPESNIFLKDSNNHIYSLRFKTFNGVITPIKVNHQNDVIHEDQQVTQTYTKEKYVTKVFPDHSRIFLYVREDERLKKKNKRKKKSQVEKCRTQSSSGKKSSKLTISDKSLPTFSSVIYLQCFDMKLVLNLPRFLKIESVRSVNEKKSESIFNKVMTHSVYKRDLVKIQFEMKDVNVDKVTPMSTHATETNNTDIVYHKVYTDITNRSLYCPLPRTTYYYCDPMIESRRKSMFQTLQMMEPIWMTALRKERTNKRKTRNREEFITFCERKGGTSIIAKIANVAIRTRCGVTKFKMYDGESSYYQWVRDLRRRLPAIKAKLDYKWCGTCEQLMKKSKEDSSRTSSRGPSQQGLQVEDWYLVRKEDKQEK